MQNHIIPSDGRSFEQHRVEAERLAEIEIDDLAPSIDDAISLVFVRRFNSEAEEFPPRNEDANSGNGFECNGDLAFVATITNIDDEAATKVHDDGCTSGISHPSLFKNIWLGDTGASCHMTNDDAGMFDCRQHQSMIKIGNGKSLLSTKIGKKNVLVVQKDGTSVRIVLPNVKFVPELYINLFSITKALSHQWQISNKGIDIILSKSDIHIQFDHHMRTQNGFISGVTMLAITDHTLKVIDSGRVHDMSKFPQTMVHITEEPFVETTKYHQHNGHQPNRNLSRLLININGGVVSCISPNMLCFSGKGQLRVLLCGIDIGWFHPSMTNYAFNNNINANDVILIDEKFIKRSSTSWCWEQHYRCNVMCTQHILLHYPVIFFTPDVQAAFHKLLHYQLDGELQYKLIRLYGVSSLKRNINEICSVWEIKYIQMIWNRVENILVFYEQQHSSVLIVQNYGEL